MAGIACVEKLFGQLVINLLIFIFQQLTPPKKQVIVQ